jgi:hypothetical protein
LVFGRAGVNPAPTFTVNSALTYTVEKNRKENKQGSKGERNIRGKNTSIQQYTNRPKTFENRYAVCWVG